VIKAVFATVDPVNALLLIILWLRIERVESRTRRIESHEMEESTA